MTDLDRQIIDVIAGVGGRFQRPAYALDCLAEHLPGVRFDMVKRRVQALEAMGELIVTSSRSRSRSTTTLELARSAST